MDGEMSECRSNKGLNQLVASLPLVSPSVDMTFVVKSI